MVFYDSTGDVSNNIQTIQYETGQCTLQDIYIEELNVKSIIKKGRIIKDV